MIGPRLSRFFLDGGGNSCSNSTSKATSSPPYSEEEDGLVPRCLAAAFQGIEARAEGSKFAVTTSVIELYNESVTDLLGSNRGRQCQVGGKDGGV
jgi:hypothetical protein